MFNMWKLMLAAPYLCWTVPMAFYQSFIPNPSWAYGRTATPETPTTPESP